MACYDRVSSREDLVELIDKSNLTSVIKLLVNWVYF